MNRKQFSAGNDTVALILLVGTNHGSVSRQIKRGIERYFLGHDLRVMVENPNDIRLKDRIANNSPLFPKPFALVGFLRDPVEAKIAHDAGILLATCSDSELPNLPHTRIKVNHQVVGQRAADHCIDIGFQYLACWNVAKGIAAQRRIAGFVARATERGRKVISIEPRPTSQALVDQLLALPSDTCLFAHQDNLTHWLAGVCQHWNIHIPGQLGLIGADDEKSVCDEAYPPLSSVRIPWDMVGEAMALGIHRQWSNPSAPILEHPPISPLDVHQRISTTRKPQRKDIVEQAAHLLAQGNSFSISSIAKKLQVPSSSLLRQFRKRYGMSMATWRQFRRVQRAMELLSADTKNVSLDQIAQQSGLGSRQSLLAACRRHMGLTPSDLRRQF